MSLGQEIHARFEEVGDRVNHILGMTLQTETDFEEAWFGLRLVGVGSVSPELRDAVTQLEVAYAALAEARTLLSSYPDLINPYLARIGMEPLFLAPLIPAQPSAPVQETIQEEKVPKKRGRPKKVRPPEELPEVTPPPEPSPHAQRLSAIRAALNAGEDPHLMEGYIGSGDKYHLFNNGDGTVLKVLHDEQQLAPMLLDCDQLAETVRGNRSFEQILGFTAEQGGAILTRFVPGQTIDAITDRKLANAPIRHYNALAKAIGYAVNHGLSLEYRSAATMYDPENGFVFIDNAIGNAPSDSQRAIDTEARMALVMFGLGEADQKTASIQEFKQAYLRMYPESRLRYDWDWRDLGA